jgi:hypothetical protein
VERFARAADRALGCDRCRHRERYRRAVLRRGLGCECLEQEQR